ncbi:MAG: FxsA family protein [Pseudomonadota bacterium]
MGLLLFIAIPAVELWLLVEVGGRIGTWEVLGLILFTGVVGWSLVKQQGLATVRRIREETAQGRIPAAEMVAGLCLVAAGLLLVTPGFLTDVAGFLLLVPPLRRLLARQLMRRFQHRIVTMQQRRGPASGGGGDGNVIDV